MEVCYTDTYNDIANQCEYKGFFNDNDEEKKFDEHGAHFAYASLYKRLEELVSNKTKISFKKLTNVFIKSRNINHNNKINKTHNVNKERFISTKHINNKSSSLTMNKHNYKNLLSNQIRMLQIKAIKEKTKMKKEKGKTKLSCSYQNMNKGIASHSIASVKYQTMNAKSRNVTNNNTIIHKTIIKEKNVKMIQSKFKEKPHSVERVNKRSVIRSSITSIKPNNYINNISLSSLKKIPYTLSSSINKKKQNQSKVTTHQVTASSTSPPKKTISSRNHHPSSILKNSIIRSIKNKSIISNTKELLSSSTTSKRAKIK